MRISEETGDREADKHYRSEAMIALRVLAIPLIIGIATVLAMVGIVSTRQSDAPPVAGGQIRKVVELEGSFRLYVVDDVYLVYVLTDQDGKPIAITR